MFILRKTHFSKATIEKLKQLKHRNPKVYDIKKYNYFNWRNNLNTIHESRYSIMTYGLYCFARFINEIIIINCKKSNIRYTMKEIHYLSKKYIENNFNKYEE
jgi:hypothetical protein